VAELARILADLKTERAQADVDRRRTLTTLADAVGFRRRPRCRRRAAARPRPPPLPRPASPHRSRRPAGAHLIWLVGACATLANRPDR